MSTAGIVAEYNPFHNGHAYHITRTRENGASAVVCVMSSWFVQRGETALMHPNARARMALMNVHKFLMLPLTFCADVVDGRTIPDILRVNKPNQHPANHYHIQD